MITKRILLITALGAALLLQLPLGAQTHDLRPMVVGNLTGNLRVQQGVPCDDDVDRLTPVTGGRLELTPADGFTVTAGKRFTLVRGAITFSGFSVSRSCLGFDRTRSYGEIGVQLSRAVTFTATSTPTPNVYSVTIPKSSFEVFYATMVNGSQETGRKHPSQDVTGTIDLAAGTVSMRVVLATSVHFEAGCTPIGCIINETHGGTLTADIAGTIVFPDTDSDGVPDRNDNCPYVANPTQAPVATPVITAPADVTLNSCADRSFGKAAATDVCEARPVTVTNNAPGTFLVGGNVVTWTATDVSGRTATDTQTVTIADTTAPTFTFVPPPIEVFNCGPVALGTATATDDCAGTPTITNNAPPIFLVGTTDVTWTATDAAGNASTAGQTVSVTDTVAPTVSCLATRPTGSSFVVSASDACATPIIKLGSYTLAEGEVVMINVTGRAGVRLIGTVAGGIRHFQVGRGEDVITATDPSGNTASAVCR